MATSCLLLAPGYGYASPERYEVDAQEIREQTSDLVSTIEGYAADQRDDAFRLIEMALEDLDYSISALQLRLQENWDHLDQATRDRASAVMNELRERRIALAEWYGGLKAATENTWNDIKEPFIAAYQAAENTFEYAREALDMSASDEKDPESKTKPKSSVERD